MLVFDVELQKVIKAPPVPADVAAPPKDAKKTKGGVFYKVLAKGTGNKKPRAWDRVKIHYSAWTTDGKMFDSSVTKERPSELALNQDIPGRARASRPWWWARRTALDPGGDGLQGQAGPPQGMLVYESSSSRSRRCRSRRRCPRTSRRRPRTPRRPRRASPTRF
jgi:peptidylprolyl isomerase